MYDPSGVKTSPEFVVPGQMKAWVLGDPDQLILRDKPTPVPGRAEVLVKFPKPVFHGDTLKAHTRIIGKRISKSRPTQGIVEFEHTATNQRGEVVASCRRTGLMHCKPQSKA